jgi:enamine deaminase RidA (YjgF/YER057c/UK114 family)
MRWLTIALLLAATPALAATPEERLAAAGYELPAPTKPVATYVTYVETGNLLFLSGHGECGETLKKGKVGGNLTIEDGAKSAERTGLCILATMKAALGDLSRVKRFVRVDGLVNSTPDFTEHPKVINGFSNLMKLAFGDDGLAARAAYGAGSLPFDFPVEIIVVVEIKPR